LASFSAAIREFWQAVFEHALAETRPGLLQQVLHVARREPEFFCDEA